MSLIKRSHALSCLRMGSWYHSHEICNLSCDICAYGCRAIPVGNPLSFPSILFASQRQLQLCPKCATVVFLPATSLTPPPHLLSVSSASSSLSPSSSLLRTFPPPAPVSSDPCVCVWIENQAKAIATSLIHITNCHLQPRITGQSVYLPAFT